MQDALSLEAIKEQLGELPVYLYKEIDSTNNEAKRLIARGEDGMALIVAEGQTAGRGRQGKSFYSPEQTGIYMTLSLPTDLAIPDAVAVTTSAAVAVFSAIREQTGIETEIKWVNDLYLDGKKVCGILTEAISDPETATIRHMIIGVGLNVHTVAFPDNLQGIATSLSPKGVSRNRMIAAIVDALVDTLRADRAEVLALYRRHSMVLGREITYQQNGEVFFARALDIDENGGLLVKHADGSRTTLQSGEISLRVQK
ncbi:MAG: biotin--[Clostridia bacterium]|nr:biotin--[acetyl-CoA-carboxylase] ligase [Clostridia bacterium]